MLRPDWDFIWMGAATMIARRSHHPTSKVGAIIVSSDNTTVISVGFNGSYAAGPNMPDSVAPGESGLIHAETNALIKADFRFPGEKTMYVTVSPCAMCAKQLVNGRISRVVFLERYRDPAGLTILDRAGVLFSQLPASSLLSFVTETASSYPMLGVFDADSVT